MMTPIRRRLISLLLAGIAAWATSMAAPSRSFAAKPSERSEASRADRRAASSTDEQLLKELDAGDEPGLPKREAAPAAELGPDADPLTRIGTKMRAAKTLIEREGLSPKTIRLQTDIVLDIDELIKKLRKQMKQQQGQPSSSSPSQPRGQSVRDKVVQPARAPQPRPNGQEPKSASDSEHKVRPPQQQPRVDLVPTAELMKRFWADLPEKDREQMRQAAEPEFLPKYRAEIQKYFRRLADGDEAQP